MASPTMQHIDDHLRAVEDLKGSAETFAQIAELLIAAFRSGRRLYLLGNGGSAADAQHIAAELVGRFRSNDRRSLPAIALTTDTSSLTAISNDFGYESVFRRQVEAHVVEGDCVWALSVSGNSPNVLRALESARERGARIIGFTGAKGTALRALCDVCVIAASEDSARVQEVHQVAYHIVCSLVEHAFVSSQD